MPDPRVSAGVVCRDLPSDARGAAVGLLQSQLAGEFLPAWIAYEDEHVIVMVKPAGMRGEPSDATAADDVVGLLRAFLAGRDGLPPEAFRLIAPRPLERDVSGAMLVCRDDRSARSLEAQFRANQVEQSFVVAVSNWPDGPSHFTMGDIMGRDRDGRVIVAEADASPQRSGDRPWSAAAGRVVGVHDDRALLAIRLRAGRPCHLRAQLAHRAVPAAGDRCHRGAPAPRLMLHASGLRVAHPGTGEPLSVAVEAPKSLERWVADGAAGYPMTRGCLEEAVTEAAGWRCELMRGQTATNRSDCFRLINRGGDGLPGVAVDVFGDYAVAHLHDVDDEDERTALFDVLSDCGFRGTYLKVHPRRASTVADATKAGLAPTEPVRGEAAPAELTVYEDGTPFLVRLGEGFGIGLFLDQRHNRRRVRAIAAGKRVLNLFAHTCAFTVVAARAGAKGTVSVDVSRPALLRGQRGVELVVGSAEDHAFRQRDVFAFLRQAHRRGERYDLIIVDPPTFSTTRGRRFASRDKDWIELMSLAFAVASSGAELLFCSNDQRLARMRFLRLADDAARQIGVRIASIRTCDPPPDFPAPVGDEPHLKSLWVQVDRADADPEGGRRPPTPPSPAGDRRRGKRRRPSSR